MSKPSTRKKVKQIHVGTIRIRTKDFQVIEKTKKTWKKSNKRFPGAKNSIKLFLAHNNIDKLIDQKDNRFLKGALSHDAKCIGARINILPDGRVLDKAYSLFATDLTLHDESSNEHWDVLYKNPGGTYSYGYTIEKKNLARKRKYNAVNEFAKRYPILKKRVSNALMNRSDKFALPMYTLLKTYMRVGNEIYYNAHGHKGMTTLKKSDIKISGKIVTFKYIGKDGVPRLISDEFPSSYIIRLREKLRNIDEKSFVFSRNSGHPLRDTDFEIAFKRYCGKAFFPQIVRSYYATKTAKEFMKTHKKPTKKEVQSLFLSIAGKLGHRKFDKKSNTWKESYNVTTHYYIRPDIVEKLNSMAEKRK